MSVSLESIGLPQVVAGLMMVALTGYVLTGGADFGGGIWDLLARGPRKAEQRRLISTTIGPIWEANHVWLIVVVVMLFTAFPAAFATLGTVLHVPLSLMLLGVVLRGSAFVFRSYGGDDEGTQRRWGRIFSVASLITPVLLGASVGAIASGAVSNAQDVITAHGDASFARVFIAPWMAPFPLAIGVLALALFAFLAAVYLALAAREEKLRDDFRMRALGAAAAVFFCAAAALLASKSGAPAMHHQLLARGWAPVFHAITGVAAVTAIWALFVRRYHVARIAGAAQVTLVLWVWAFAQYPLLLPPSRTIGELAAPRITLELLCWGLAGGTVILAPSLMYLYHTFAGVNQQHE